MGGGRAAWERQVGFFESKGYRCMAWNQPGYGDAPMVEPYDLETVVAVLARQVTAPAVIVGHSMGGFVAQEFYARYPDRVRALALCFTSAAFGGDGSEFARKFIEARILPLDQGRSMADIAGALMPTMAGSRSDPTGLALARATMGAIAPDTYRKAVRLLTTFDRRSQLPTIGVPTLLLAGGDDRTAPAPVMERMAAKIPGAEYVLLEGCGHLGPMDQPGPFNAALLAFLQRHGL